MPSSPQYHLHASLQESLSDLHSILLEIDDRDFCDKESSVIRGSIGEHIRHSLDHLRAFLSVVSCKDQNSQKEQNAVSEKSRIFYDRRERGMKEETDRYTCLLEIKRIQGLFGDLYSQENAYTRLDQKVEVEHVIDAKGTTAVFSSYADRELMFIYHHLLHHYAMIAFHLRLLRKNVPSSFGVAPATLKEQL